MTASRGLAGPIVLAMLLHFDTHWPAFATFAVAMLTDLVDGALAARFGSNRQLGAFLDPLSDKILGTCSWIGLLLVGWAPWWLAGPLLVRDVVVAVSWRLLRARGLEFRASRLGQLATSFEGTSLGLLLFHGPLLGVHWPSVGVTVGVVGLALSIGSAWAYVLTGPESAA